MRPIISRASTPTGGVASVAEARSASMNKGATSEGSRPSARAMVPGSRTKNSRLAGTSAGVNICLSSGARSKPTMVWRPSGRRTAGGRKSAPEGTKPRLMKRIVPSSSCSGAIQKNPMPPVTAPRVFDGSVARTGTPGLSRKTPDTSTLVSSPSAWGDAVRPGGRMRRRRVSGGESWSALASAPRSSAARIASFSPRPLHLPCAERQQDRQRDRRGDGGPEQGAPAVHRSMRACSASCGTAGGSARPWSGARARGRR